MSQSPIHHCRRRLSRIRLLGQFRFRIYFSEIYESIWTVGRTPWTGDQPGARPLTMHRTTQHRKTRTHIHASSGFRNHDPSVWAAEDSPCLRPLGHWDQLSYQLWSRIYARLTWISLNAHHQISKGSSYISFSEMTDTFINSYFVSTFLLIHSRFCSFFHPRVTVYSILLLLSCWCLSEVHRNKRKTREVFLPSHTISP
jgi:hypothetical protein